MDRTTFEAEILQNLPGYAGQPIALRDACWTAFDTLHNHTAKAKKGLEALDKAMSDLVAQALPQDVQALEKAKAHLASRTAPRKPNAAKSPAAFSKLLSRALAAEEQKAGFTGAAKTFLGSLDPNEFRSQVKQGHRWKDPLVPPDSDHGEFTHRIQLYLLLTTAPIPAVTRGWPGFYETAGSLQHTQKNDLADRGIWDALFDRQPPSPQANVVYGTTSPDQFSSPENLHRYLCQDQTNTSPLLSTFLKARHEKRIAIIYAEGDEDDYPLLRAYIMKKKFPGRSYDQLGGGEKALVDSIVGAALDDDDANPDPKALVV